MRNSLEVYQKMKDKICKNEAEREDFDLIFISDLSLGIDYNFPHSWSHALKFAAKKILKRK